MSITLNRIDPQGSDREALIEFFTSNAFPFHVRSGPWTCVQVEDHMEAGEFCSDDTAAYWLDDDVMGRAGYLRFEDLHDDTAMFDLRLGREFRGRGLGAESLRAAADLLFTTTAASRFEGQTRDDNAAMRAVFERAGWTKEAHYRRAWPTADGHARDTVGYAILREEWEHGTAVGFLGI